MPTPEMTPPTLGELAARYTPDQGPPTGIPLATTLIAECSPTVLHGVSLQTVQEYYTNKTFAEQTDGHWQQLLDKHIGHAAERREEAIAFNEEFAGKWQDIVGMVSSSGGTPTAEDLNTIFAFSDAAEAARASQPLADKRVKTLQQRVVRAAMDQFNAQQRVAELETDLPLAHEVQAAYTRLSRGGRIRTVVGGLAIGTLASLGLLWAAGEAPTQEVATTQQASEKTDTAVAEYTFKQILAALTPIVGGASGAVVASYRKGHYARRKAQSLIRTANQPSPS